LHNGTRYIEKFDCIEDARARRNKLSVELKGYLSPYYREEDIPVINPDEINRHRTILLTDAEWSNLTERAAKLQISAGRFVARVLKLKKTEK